jgi:hypothetical protein
VVSPWRVTYLEALGTPILRGRSFDDGDRPDTERVMLIDESLAKRSWWRCRSSREANVQAK